METGTSLNAAFRKYPLYFDSLYCNLVEAGEAAGILRRCSTAWPLHGKTEAIKSKIKSALMYPISVVVAFRGGDRDHDFRDSGVQGGVHFVWRRICPRPRCS